MKITIVMPGFVWVPGGSHRVVYEYANELAKRGHSIQIIYPRRFKNYDVHSTSLSNRIRELIKYTRRHITKNPRPAWFPLDERVETLSVGMPLSSAIPSADVVLATSWNIAEYVAHYPDSKGERFYIVHHPEANQSNYPTQRVNTTYKLPLKKFAVSQWTCAQIKSLGATNVAYIPNGIDHQIYRLTKPIVERSLQIAMGYVPKRIKDPETGIKAISLAQHKYPALKVIFFGVSKPGDSIPNWVTYYRNPSNQFVVEQIYNNSVIFLNSSIIEGFGFPMAEAMACGCALVATDSGGVRDFAKHNTTALLSSPQNPEALAENLCLLLENDRLRNQIVFDGQQAIKKFTWQHSADLLEKYFKGEEPVIN